MHPRPARSFRAADRLGVKAAPLLHRQAEGRPSPAARPVPSRLGTVLALVGAGLFVTGLGDALARSGHQAPALPMFFVGLVTIFVPCAWRLTSGGASRSERVAVSLVLGIGLLGSYYIRSPLIFDWFDELIHGATLNRMLADRTLAVHNGILPVSPFYPGLELVTVAVKWTTGLPVVLAQLAVVLAQRVVLVLCVFLVVERVCRSARAGGIGVLVYVANPSFYTFASWDYGPLALAFAVAVVHFLLSSLDRSPSPPRRGPFRVHRDLALALASMAALVVTHHLTALLTAGLLVVWAIGLWTDGRPRDARVIGASAAVGVVLVVGWSAFVGSHLFSYLGPIFTDASNGLSSALGQHHSTRPLFHTDSSQGGSSLWEIAVMLAATVSFCLLLCPSALAVLRNRTGRRGLLRFLPLTVAAAYPFAMLASISSGSSQVGERTTTFIFFGMAVVVGGWLAARLAARRTLVEQVATIAIAAVCFLGSMIFGSGPDITYVPGPYLVAANQRSFGAPTLAAARWASTHLAAGSNIAADRQSGALMADLADVNLVTSITGLESPAPLFFSPRFTPSDLGLIRKDHIRYLVVDRRLASSLPLFGTYFEPGEAKPGTRLTPAELAKFDSVPGIDRIYDNGPVQIYDVSRLLRTAPVTSSGPRAAPTGPDPVVLSAAAVAVVVISLARRRRRGGHERSLDRVLVRWTVGAMVSGVVLAAVTVPSGVSPTVIGLAVLGVLTVVLAGTRTSLPAQPAPSAGGPRHTVEPGLPSQGGAPPHRIVGIALLVAGAVLALRNRHRGGSAHLPH